MFSWLNIPQPPEATWLDFASLYIGTTKKYIQYSETDGCETPIVLRGVPSIPVGGKGFGVDFTPLTFISCYYIQSTKGKNTHKLPQVSFIRLQAKAKKKRILHQYKRNSSISPVFEKISFYHHLGLSKYSFNTIYFPSSRHKNAKWKY